MEPESLFGSFVFVRTFDGAAPEGEIVVPVHDLPMVFATRCARPILGCEGDSSRQFLLGVGREVFRRWLPPGGRDQSSGTSTEVWHVGSLESPLTCREPSRFRAVIAIAGERICVC